MSRSALRLEIVLFAPEVTIAELESIFPKRHLDDGDAHRNVI